MNLINRTVISRATNSEGIITGIKSDGIMVSFTDGFGSIIIPLERFDDLVKSDASISETVNEIKEKQQGSKEVRNERI